MRSTLAACLALLALAGCATFPRSGPTVPEVVLNEGQAIRVVDIGPATVSAPSISRTQLPGWTIADQPMWRGGILAGDTLEITVFEVGFALFASGQPGAGLVEADPSGSGFRFPPIRVEPEGMVTLPYGGTLPVIGLTGSEVARRYQERLRGQSQNAQVLATVRPGPRQSVMLSGEVKQPGRVTLTEADERLLDAVALAGGPQSRAEDTLVTLTRNGQTSTARLSDITPVAPENVLLLAGDTVQLSRHVRSLTVLGAAARVSEIVLDDEELTLSEALARAGGPAAERADPSGVFIFRRTVDSAGNEEPVIYRLDLLDPADYFAAQEFLMRQGDIMLIADARSNRLESFLRMVNALAAPIVTVDVLTR